MPFDMMQNGGGGGGWNDPHDLLAKALAIVVSSLFGAGARPGNFGPGHDEIINLDLALHVSPDGKQFRVTGARMLRWEQIETDPESENDDPIG